MPWIIGGLGVAGSLLGGLFGGSAQSSANKTNIKLNRENRDWQEMMSNTSYQRGTKDMIAAGLNPMLAFSQGGANTPSNTAATVDAVTAPAEGINSAANKALLALQAQKFKAEIDNIKANTQQTGATTSGIMLENVIKGQDSSAQGLRYRLESQNYGAQKLYKEIEGQIERNRLTAAEARQFERTMPFMLRLATADAQIREQGIPEAEANAKLWKQLEQFGEKQGWGGDMIAKAISLIRSISR